MNSIRCTMRATAVATLALMTSAAWSAPSCPLSYGTTDATKSHKLFLYFPTADDASFPSYTTNASPARVFDVAALDPAIGTTAALRDRIHDVVTDDYCEFNVQVLSTTTKAMLMWTPPGLQAVLSRWLVGKVARLCPACLRRS